MVLSSLSVPFLTILLVIPLISLIPLFFLRKIPSSNFIQCVLLVAIFECLVFFCLLGRFDFQETSFQFFEHHSWLSLYNLDFDLGVDQVSCPFLGALLVSCFFCVWFCKNLKQDERRILVFLLILTFLLISLFCSTNILIFFVSAELSWCVFFLLIRTEGDALKGSEASTTKWLDWNILVGATSMSLLLSILMLSTIQNPFLINLFQEGNTFFKTMQFLLLFSLLLRFSLLVFSCRVLREMQRGPVRLFVFSTFILLHSGYVGVRFISQFLNNPFFEKWGLFFLFLVLCRIAYCFSKEQQDDTSLSQRDLSLPREISLPFHKRPIRYIPLMVPFFFCQLIFIPDQAVLIGAFLGNTVLCVVLILFLTSYEYRSYSLMSQFETAVDVREIQKKQYKFWVARSYVFLSLIGVPGTLGFFVHYKVCQNLLETGYMTGFCFYLVVTIMEFWMIRKNLIFKENGL